VFRALFTWTGGVGVLQGLHERFSHLEKPILLVLVAINALMSPITLIAAGLAALVLVVEDLSVGSRAATRC
jgi:hypothetical protein